MDAVSQEALLAALAGLRSRGAAVVVSTHDLALAHLACDEVCLLNRHQVAFGPTGTTLTPELLRAARNIGTPSDRRCPICELADRRAEIAADESPSLRLVTYVFGADLRRKSGTPVWNREELLDRAPDHRSSTAYTVECCLVCGWNHLHERVLMGKAHAD